VAQRGAQIRHVVQGEHAQDEVIAASVELKEVGLPVVDVRPGPPGPRQLDHRPGQVDRVHLLEPLGQRHRLPSRATSQVQRALAAVRQDRYEPPFHPVPLVQIAQPVIVHGDTVERLSFRP